MGVKGNRTLNNQIIIRKKERGELFQRNTFLKGEERGILFNKKQLPERWKGGGNIPQNPSPGGGLNQSMFSLRERWEEMRGEYLEYRGGRDFKPL